MDLIFIFEYIAVHLNSKQTAINKVKEITKCISKLDSMPNRHPLYKNLYWGGRGLRILVVENYNVFYITDQKGNKVVIVRIQYGGRDVERQFKDSLGVEEVTIQ